jgi:hypothetical protein
LPAIIVAAGDKASRHLLEFSAVMHTRAFHDEAIAQVSSVRGIGFGGLNSEL